MPPIEASKEGIHYTDSTEYYSKWRSELNLLEGNDAKNPVPVEFNFDPKFDQIEEENQLGKITQAALNKAQEMFIGDGSIPTIFFGQRTPIPDTDRALVLLASLTNTFESRGDWSKLTVLSAGCQLGETVDSVTTHIDQKLTSFVTALTKIPLINTMIKPEDRETAQEQSDEIIAEVRQLWRESNDELKKHKSEADEKLWSEISDSLKNPNVYERTRTQLKEIDKIVPPAYKTAISQAQSMLSKIPKPEGELQTVLSPLGRAIILKHALSEVTPLPTPEKPEEFLQHISDQIIQLKNLDYQSLSKKDSIQITQVQLRASIVSEILQYVKSPEILLTCIQARCDLVKALNVRSNKSKQYQDLGIYNSSSPEDTGIYLKKALENAAELQRQHGISKESLYQSGLIAGLFTILEESHEDFDKARYTLTSIISALQSPQRKYLGQVILDREPQVLNLLGLAKPQNPLEFAPVTPEQKAILHQSAESMPDYSYSENANSPERAFTSIRHASFQGFLYSHDTQQIESIHQGLQQLLLTYLAKIN